MQNSPSRLAFDQAAEARRQARFTESQKITTDGIAAAQKRGDRAEEALLLVALGVAIDRQTDGNQAEPYFDKALTLARMAPAPLAEAHALYFLGSLRNEMGQNAEAIPLLKESLALARKLMDRSLEIMALGRQGEAYQDQGEPERARSYFQEALALAQKSDPTDLCFVLLHLHDFHRENEEFSQAEQVLAQLSQTLVRKPSVLGDIYYSLSQAQLSLKKKQLAQALIQLNRTRKKAQAAGATRIESLVLLLLANLYDDLKQGESALASATEALSLARKTGSRWDEINATVMQAMALSHSDRDKEAADTARQSVVLADKHGYPRMQLRGLTTLAMCEYASDQAESALATAKRAEALLEKYPDDDLSSYLAIVFAGIYSQKGQHDLAESTLRKSIDRIKLAKEKTTPLMTLIGLQVQAKNYDRALATSVELVTLAQKIGDKKSEGYGLMLRASTLSSQDKDQEAVVVMEQAVGLYHEAGLIDEEASALAQLAVYHYNVDQYNQMEECSKKSAALFVKQGKPKVAGTTLTSLVAYLIKDEKFDAAQRLLEEALPLLRESKAVREQAVALHYLAQIQGNDEQYDKAFDTLEKALALYQEAKDRSNEAVVLRSIAAILSYQNQEDRAQEYLERAKAIEATLKK
ncbi:tetratricopeptide repeat protein [Armatimonas rosea]|uniref:Tetratricopeptide (TPR) repeat protein n=1 Tax=Armatimonas rosea TaxID=685828 RepID=A0A7W9SQ56_ARMRO|nr:tetratricopeptide repeat protein [Armatimonas rosea]MBB6050410.1 tetratricopeptide (TPR) repeat protein [Armatimonas rosea]